MREVPVGCSDFRELRDRNLYYVDRTYYIGRFVDYESRITLLARPHRCGKTLSLSMLDAYLNIRYAGEPDRFEGLEISKRRPNDPEKNSNPVILMSFKGLGTGTYDSFLAAFADRMSELFASYPELRTSERLNGDTKEVYESIVSKQADKARLMLSPNHLCQMLNAHYGKRVVVLIDDCDDPVIIPESSIERDQVEKFMEIMLQHVLNVNHNRSFGFAVVMSARMVFDGYAPVYGVDNKHILTYNFWGLFEFKQRDVELILKEYGEGRRINEARAWYGPDFNPYSIVNYVASGFVPKVYRTDVGNDPIMDAVLAPMDRCIFSSLTEMALGLHTPVFVDTVMTYRAMTRGEESLMSMLVLMGYLNAYRDDLRTTWASVPNLETRHIFASEISRVLSPPGTDLIGDFLRAMGDADRDAMLGCLDRAFEYSAGGRVRDDELIHHAFQAGAMMLIGAEYSVDLERRLDDGFFHISPTSKTRGRRDVRFKIEKAGYWTPYRDRWQKPEIIISEDPTAPTRNRCSVDWTRTLYIQDAKSTRSAFNGADAYETGRNPHGRHAGRER